MASHLGSFTQIIPAPPGHRVAFYDKAADAVFCNNVVMWALYVDPDGSTTIEPVCCTIDGLTEPWSLEREYDNYVGLFGPEIAPSLADVQTSWRPATSAKP